MTYSPETEGEFLAPQSVTLTGEGLRNLDEADFIKFVGEMAQRGILVMPASHKEEDDIASVENEREPILLKSKDFEVAAGDRFKYTHTRTFNNLTRPAYYYRLAVVEKENGKALSFSQAQALNHDPQIIAISPRNHVIDYEALRAAHDEGLTKDMKGIGEQAMLVIEAVLEQKAKELAELADHAHDT